VASSAPSEALNSISERQRPWHRPSLETQFRRGEAPMGTAVFRAPNKGDEDNAGKGCVLQQR